MLKLMDLGCRQHQSCQVTLNGLEATIVINIIRNLPKAGEKRTYICSYGQTHHLCCHGPGGELGDLDPGFMFWR